MKKHNIIEWATASIAVLVIGAVNGYSNNFGTTNALPPNSIERFIESTKKPAAWISFGGDLRLRDEYLNNSITLDEDAPRSEQNYFRFRGRIWSSIKPVDDFNFNIRLTAEPRNYTKPSFHKTPITGQDWTEGIIDIFNIQYKNAFGLPLTMTIGRQDLMLGDPLNWWLVADGTPLDGSRTYFLDAARFTIHLKEQKTTIDLIGIYQSAMNDAWLPPINHLEKPLTEQNEKGAIFYLSNKSIKNTQVDAYFMYKHDDYKVANGDDADIYTIVSKVTGDITENLKYSIEGAYQFGERRTPTTPWQDISAFGFNNKLTYLFKDKMNSQIRLSHEYLSGDDPNTDKFERFDLLWGRWPRWSELYIYSYIYESRVAQTENYHRFGPGFSFTPVKDITFSADYNAIFAPEERTATLPNAAKFGKGDFRGHYIQTWLKYKISKHISGHLWSEFIWVGDYYAKRDLFTFLRAEVYLTW